MVWVILIRKSLNYIYQLETVNNNFLCRAGVTCVKAETEVKEYRDIQESCCQCCKDGHRAGIFQQSCTLPFAENEYCSVSFKTCCQQGEYRNWRFNVVLWES